MLTFLRKIRRSLIASGAAQKYLLYAIGEVLLVVIGILIALQINAWNNNRIDKHLEKQILARIVQDLKTDLGDLAVSSFSNEMRILFGVQILEALGRGQDSIRASSNYQLALANHESFDNSNDPSV